MNISKRGTIDDEDHGGDVDDRFVCHHVDYASKALERRTELDELRKKALAKNKAERLQDAEAPKETLLNFMERQREFFEQRRRNEAEALQALHQYRADDELVFRLAALKNNSNKRTVTSNSTRPCTLTPSDARSRNYHINDVNNTHQHVGRSTHGTLEDRNHLNQQQLSAIDKSGNIACGDIRPFCILTDRIEFDTARQYLQRVTNEACRVPLPPDSDNDGNGDVIKERSNLKMEGFILTGHDHDSHDQQNGILIAEGSADCVNNDDHNDVEPYSSQSFIPFESFLKLGESQIMQQSRHQQFHRYNNHTHQSHLSSSHEISVAHSEDDIDDIPTTKSIESTTTSSTIPVESFLQLGASLMVDSPPSRDEAVNPITLDDTSVKATKSENTRHHVVLISSGDVDDEEDKTTSLTEFPSQGVDQIMIDSLTSTFTDSMVHEGEGHCSTDAAAEHWTVSSSTLEFVKGKQNDDDTASKEKACDHTSIGQCENQPIRQCDNQIQTAGNSDCSEDIVVEYEHNATAKRSLPGVNNPDFSPDEDLQLQQQQQQQQQPSEPTAMSVRHLEREPSDAPAQSLQAAISRCASTSRPSRPGRGRPSGKKADSSYHRPSSLFVGRLFFSR